ncbi:MAG: hypothetical protein AAB478_04585 [Patescibacteria group bacterium]
MNESEFIRSLQERAKEQHQLLEDMPLPHLFALVTTWLSDHPWRYLIPLALLITLIARNLLGHNFTELVLKVFYHL